MKHICLKEGEVVKEGSVLLRLLDEQPPEGLKLCYISDEYVSFTKVGFTWRIKLRYPSGEYLVKETWGEEYFDFHWRYLYKICRYTEEFGYPHYDIAEVWDGTVVISTTKAGGKNDKKMIAKANKSIGWRSPVTMPLSAVRYKVVVETTVAQQEDNLWYEVVKITRLEKM